MSQSARGLGIGTLECRANPAGLGLVDRCSAARLQTSSVPSRLPDATGHCVRWRNPSRAGPPCRCLKQNYNVSGRGRFDNRVGGSSLGRCRTTSARMCSRPSSDWLPRDASSNDAPEPAQHLWAQRWISTPNSTIFRTFPALPPAGNRPLPHAVTSSPLNRRSAA